MQVSLLPFLKKTIILIILSCHYGIILSLLKVTPYIMDAVLQSDTEIEYAEDLG